MSSTAREYNNKHYIKHLFSKEIEGYIQVVEIKNKKIVELKNYKGLAIVNELKNYKGKKDTFVSINTSYNGKRLVENIRQLRALYIDLDKRDYTFSQLTYAVWDLVLEDKIPAPTMIVSSGRGVHVYWRIEHAPYQALATWQELEDYLYYQLKSLGADKKAIDASRILRLPDTINSKNNEKCKVVVLNNRITYSMYDLREKYLKWKPKIFKEVEVEKKVKNKTVKSKVVNYFTSYSLHIARADDIVTLCKLRDYNLTGYRNMILHCYAYWLGVTERDTDSLEEAVNELNNKFTRPLKQTEVNAILRCVPKAIDKFIDYEQGLRDGKIKRVTKGMFDKGGYWYKNETLIERLDITIEEQRHLKTIISAQVKYERKRFKDNETKKANRRNEAGLTAKQQELANLKIKVLQLREQGLTMQAIADKLKINKTKVIRLSK